MEKVDASKGAQSGHHMVAHQTDDREPVQLLFPMNLCLFCFVAFPSFKHLQDHLLIVHADAFLKPNIFFLASPVNHSYIQFAPRVTPPALNVNASYKCMMCDTAFPSLSDLKTHTRTIHPNHESFGCGVCGKHFTHSHSLNTHMRIHTGERPYKCHLCGKRFARLYPCNVHIRKHTGEKPHNCRFCGKGFVKKWDLTTHVRTHTGQKSPHKCRICGAEFCRQCNLFKHMGQHA